MVYQAPISYLLKRSYSLQRPQLKIKKLQFALNVYHKTVLFKQNIV